MLVTSIPLVGLYAKLQAFQGELKGGTPKTASGPVRFSGDASSAEVPKKRFTRSQLEQLIAQACQTGESDLNQLAKTRLLDLSGENLSKMDLSGLRIRALLAQTNLSEALLEGTGFENSIFDHTNLSRIDLKTTDFGNCNLTTVNFDGARNANYRFVNFPGYQGMVRQFVDTTGIQLIVPPGTQHAVPSILKGLNALPKTWLQAAGTPKGNNLPNDGRLIIELVNDPNYPYGGAFYPGELKVRMPTHTNDANRTNTIVHEVAHYLDRAPSLADPKLGPFSSDPKYIRAFKQDAIKLLEMPGDRLSGDVDRDFETVVGQFMRIYPPPENARFPHPPANLNIRDNLQYTYGAFRHKPDESGFRFEERVKIFWYLADEVFTKRYAPHPREAWAEFIRRTALDIDPDVLEMMPSTRQYFKELLQQPDMMKARRG